MGGSQVCLWTSFEEVHRPMCTMCRSERIDSDAPCLGNLLLVDCIITLLYLYCTRESLDRMLEEVAP